MATGIAVADEGVDAMLDSGEKRPQIVKTYDAKPVINHNVPLPDSDMLEEAGLTLWYALGGTGVGFTMVGLGICLIFCKRKTVHKDVELDSREPKSV